MSDCEERSEELLAYLQGEIDVEDCRKLVKELLESDDLRQQLLELATEEAALMDWAKVEKSSRELDDEAFREDFRPADSGLVIPIPKRKQLTGWWVAAAVLVISAAGFFLLEAKSPSPEVVDGVAHLVSSVDAEWDGVTPVLNRPLAPEEYELTRGTVDLLFADGARVSVSGPARFDLRSARHIHLESGKLVANIPDEALGFIVTSPQSEVVDLGTEFGLSVDDAGLTDVHVMDGLVEVLPAERESSGQPSGVMISQGEARRFRSEKSTDSVSIPVSSRAGLIGPQRSGEIGLDMLRGSVRVVDRIAKDDLNDISEGPSWIDLAVERRDVLLGEPLTVSIDAPGSYRNFVSPQATLSPGQRVNSYLLHFRPNSFSHVSGVIRFDQPIVAILCTAEHLRKTDALLGVPSVYYPSVLHDFQGLEPNKTSQAKSDEAFRDWKPDEIILSQDRTTISIRTSAAIEAGYDQIRILTEAEREN